jgi:ribose transport system substrate-binding protein
VKRRTLWMPILGVAGSLLFGLTACGSDNSSTSTSTSSASTSSSTSSGSAVKDAAKAAAIVDPLTTRPTSIGLTEPVKGKIAPGKTIDFISCGAPACAALGSYVKSGGETLGWTVNVINAPYQTPEDVKNVWAKVVGDKPDGVIASGGYDRSTYQSELNQLKAAKTPVFEIGTGAPAAGGVTYDLDGPQEYVRRGQRLAQWVIARSGGAAKTGVLNPVGVSGSALQVKSFNEEMTSNCPSCKTSNFDIPVSALGSDLAGRTANEIQSNTGINYFVPAWGDLADGVPAALAAAGISGVSIVTQAMSPATAQALKAGKVVSGVYGFPAAEISWRGIDAMARLFNNESIEPDKANNQPEWFLTKDNLPPDYKSGYFPLVGDYQAQFKKLWGRG